MIDFICLHLLAHAMTVSLSVCRAIGFHCRHTSSTFCTSNLVQTQETFVYAMLAMDEDVYTVEQAPIPLGNERSTCENKGMSKMVWRNPYWLSSPLKGAFWPSRFSFHT